MSWGSNCPSRPSRTCSKARCGPPAIRNAARANARRTSPTSPASWSRDPICESGSPRTFSAASSEDRVSKREPDRRAPKFSSLPTRFRLEWPSRSAAWWAGDALEDSRTRSRPLEPRRRGAAGDKSLPAAGFTAGTEVVNLTVTVRDASGQLVSDLSPGRLRRSSRTGGPRRSSSSPRPSKPGQDEALALDLGLLLDTSESMAKEIKLTQEAASRFLEAIPAGPRPADGLLRPGHPHLALRQRAPAGALRAHPRGQGLGQHRALRCDRRLPVARAGLGGPQGARAPDRRRGLHERPQPGRGDRTLVRSSSVTIYPIAFPGEYPLGSNRALSARSFLRSLADMTGGNVFTPVGVEGPAGDLREDPGRAVGAVRARLHLRQPEARRQAPQAEGRT